MQIIIFWGTPFGGFRKRVPKSLCHESGLRISRQERYCQLFTFGISGEGFFLPNFIRNIFSRIFCSRCCFRGRHASWLQAYYKVSCLPNPKYRSALTERSKTILMRSATGDVSADCCAHPARSICCMSYRKEMSTFRRISAMFLQNLCTFTGTVETIFRKTSANISLIFCNFSKCSLQCVVVVAVCSLSVK